MAPWADWFLTSLDGAGAAQLSPPADGEAAKADPDNDAGDDVRTRPMGNRPDLEPDARPRTREPGAEGGMPAPPANEPAAAKTAPLLKKAERDREENAPLRKVNTRRSGLLAELGKLDAPSPELYSDEGGDGPLHAGLAIESFAAGENMKAVLYAQAALGADPGNGARRTLLRVLEKRTGIKADPDGVLPLHALVHHELRQASQAFFDRRFGAAIQACRRALLLAPDDSRAWTKLGSAQYALGNERRARTSLRKALELNPDDRSLSRFIEERGW
ncbi:MAG: tetratricopeptide repeat protein [Elusimicrobiota bacterium]